MTQAALAYEELLLEYKPRPIRNESDCRKSRRALEELMKPRPSRAESELIEVLATLIEQYEAREYPTPNVPARRVLEHLMESRGISRAELARATGIPRSTLTNVLTGKRELSKANVRELARHFGVSPMAFLAEAL
jgi:HTH-type transcriptional regulator / antitoxin HigA